MSSLKNARIKAFIEQHLAGLIDLSSIVEHERPDALLTRGIAALAAIAFTGCSYQDAADSIVDGGGDKGIDAIHYDNYSNIVYFIQSKWSRDGNKTIDEAAAHKLTHGVQKLLTLDLDGFNQKIQSKKDILEKITNDASVKIVLCPSYNSNNHISQTVKEIFDQYIATINDGDEIISLQVANQSKIYEVTSKLRGPVNEDIVMRNWTKTTNSGHNAYFGFIAASDLASLFEKHQDSLFIPNIRVFKGDTDVNNLIVESLIREPNLFYLLNNGITLIANEIKKKPIGGASRESAIFECNGIAVVNGAQTVGSCSRAYKKDKEKTDVAYVFAKFIETKQNDNELSVAITKAANTQNRIERKDFVATDPFQKELQEGLDILGIKYIFKTGESIKEEDGFDLTYVTQALIADAGDINLIAIGKREIGRIWDDVNKAPYKTLFNPSNPPYYVKNIILLFSEILNIIKLAAREDRRKLQYVTYGNIFIASQCMKKVDKTNIKTENYNFDGAKALVYQSAEGIFNSIYNKIEEIYPGTPLVYLFRNTKKLNEIDSLL